MIYIYDPHGFREEIVEMLDSMGIDFTEDAAAALIGVRKRLAAREAFDYGKLRNLISTGTTHREISRRMQLPNATWWRHARKVPIEEIPEEHRDFFMEHRVLIETKGAVAKLTRGLCDELGKQGMREVLGTGTQAPSGHMRRGRRSSVRGVPQGKDRADGD